MSTMTDKCRISKVENNLTINVIDLTNKAIGTQRKVSHGIKANALWKADWEAREGHLKQRGRVAAFKSKTTVT